MTSSRQHAGAAELEKLHAAVARHQRADIELARAVEPVVPFGNVLAQHPIGADHGGLAQRTARRRVVIDHQHVLADRIERIDVAPCQHGRRIGDCRHFLIEDLKPQALGAADVGGGACQPNFERTQTSERFGDMRNAHLRNAQAAIGAERRQETWQETRQSEARQSQAGEPHARKSRGGKRVAEAMHQTTRRHRASMDLHSGYLVPPARSRTETANAHLPGCRRQPTNASRAAFF